MNTAIVALGSNIKPEMQITEARRRLKGAFHVLKESAFVYTKPIGYMDQPDFINGAVLLETMLDADELRSSLKEMELTMGRESSKIKFGPRSIDLDVVVFNDRVIDQDFYQREYLKQSVLELIPQLVY